MSQIFYERLKIVLDRSRPNGIISHTQDSKVAWIELEIAGLLLDGALYLLALICTPHNAPPEGIVEIDDSHALHSHLICPTPSRYASPRPFLLELAGSPSLKQLNH